ncbi:hypothetical protein BKA67DRAFT_661335 [Truncatella angustata]|uniref:LOV domain-containing protein n=1 Tax=Truncatella angustata TaxID=152316 RepID=A0A9P8ZUL5_9PEZI|nr:uncharacterized protein BKA67DRAFT_661335 [Truncatella angustata]KAH6648353.1 hypothetical protein BKA67DRAFT_661335 [Truncatella angustata]KAH8204793.1 hypothetical protein TruAng_000982 [Truncatella angustata]
MPKPRGIHPFHETPEFDTDFSNTDDVHKEVSWPMPDHYERKPDPEALPFQKDCKDEIEAANQVVADDEPPSRPFSGGWNRVHGEGSTASEKILHGDQLRDNYSAREMSSFIKKGNQALGDMHQDQTSRLSTVTESRSATPPPVSRSRRYIIDDEFAELSELPSPDSFFGVSATTMKAYISEHPDEVGSSDGSTAKPPTVIRNSDVAPLRVMSPLGRADDTTRPDEHYYLVEEESGQTKTPALDRIHKFENTGLSPTKGKAPSYSSQQERIYKSETGQAVNHQAIFYRKNDSGVGISDRSGSSREKATSSQDASDPSHISSRPSEGSNRPLDFFSQSIFQVVLHNPATSHQLLKYCQNQLCSENVEFLHMVENYRTNVNNLAGILAVIHQSFISGQSQRQINISGEIVDEVHSNMKSLVKDGLPAMEALFEPMQEKIEHLVFTDIYPRFVRYQVAMDTAKSLSNNRRKYQGLGDCFCFSNPGIADNPVVYASDGFVQVTGYSRSEIIPRNCRFLQGPQTDRAAVRRIKEALVEGRETVELLLNYKKDGAPFWNLLYMAPLRDATGKIAFFLGAQINCSTAIHSNTDVMRVLSESNEETTTKELSRQGQHVNKLKKKTLFSIFSSDKHNKPPLPDENTGMERKLLNRIEGQDLRTQITEFYSAYSKYIVIRADTFVIGYYSSEITDSLLPTQGTGIPGSHPSVGQDIFKFFKQYQLNTHQADFKTPVKKAIKSGYPISTEIRLQTRRSAVFRGDENFATHWTPLKNEHGAPHWVVLTLASMMGPENM